MNNEVWFALGGGFITSLGASLYYATNEHKVSIYEVLWTLSCFRKKLLAESLVVVGGFLMIAGIAFDFIGYDNIQGIEPYGEKDNILIRTSMYGFSLGAFLIGLGSQLLGNDLIGLTNISSSMYHNLKSFICLTLLLLTAILISWLADSSYLGILTNQNVNPPNSFVHIISANVCIVISIVLFTVSSCIRYQTQTDLKIILKLNIGTFLSAMLIALGFILSGLARRDILFNSLTPGIHWKPILLIFLGVLLLTNFITSFIFQKKFSIPEREPHIEIEAKQSVMKYVIGAVVFGFGWGLAGLDISTYLIHSAIFTIPVVIFYAVFLVIGLIFGTLFS